MLRATLALLFLAVPLTAHTNGGGGWGNVPSAIAYKVNVEPIEGVPTTILRLYYSDGSGLGLTSDGTTIESLGLFTTEFWPNGADLSGSLAATAQGPIVGGDTQTVSTRWRDANGSDHEVRTPICGSGAAAIRRCYQQHKALVAIMQKDYPPIVP